jgi:tyrosine-protein kinase Etk/Wzc
VVRKLRRDDVVDELQRSLTATEQGKDTGLVELALKGTDPRKVASTIETLATSYVRQSLEETSAEAANALRVLEEQIPPLKAKVEAAESAVDRFHRRNGAVNLSVDGQRLMLRLGDVEHAISQAKAAETERIRRHTDRYPEAAEPAKDLPRLEAERAALEAQLDALPALELEYARLVRQVGATTERYTRVANRAEELRIVKSSWGGNARLVEHAFEQRRPVSPEKGLALALAMVIGLAGGVVTAFLRNAFDAAIRDPDEIEARTGVPVFATIPRSAAQQRIAKRAGRRKRLHALSMVDPGDAAVEDLRALRSGVQFALRRASNGVVVVSSPAPSAGKSFVSVNLAHLLAAVDGRVLLVDGDLRRGVLHRYFGLAEKPGVTDILLGEATLETAVHRSDDANLDVLPMGKRVTNPGELVASAAFRQLLEDVRGRYKVVIVDTTPILSVPDSAVVARDAGVTLLVVRAGEQNVHDVSLAVKRLVQNGATVRGAVLNDVRPTLGHYGRSGEYRRYDARHA